MYWFGDDLFLLYKPLNLSDSDIAAEIEFIFDVEFGVKYKDYILGKKITDEQKSVAKAYIEKRVKTDRPIQQILGKAYFMGEVFEVNENTLIPRPETELILEALTDYYNCDEEFTMLEIGLGSGCISVMAAKLFPKAKIVGVDISKQCVDTSWKNACNKGVEKNVNLLLSDVFDKVDGVFDVIVSNPPYISLKDIDSVQENVYIYEPSSALFADNDGYFFYEKIISEGAKYIKKNSVIIFEMGIGQDKRISEIFVQNNFSDIKILKDINGINRVISAKY